MFLAACMVLMCRIVTNLRPCKLVQRQSVFILEHVTSKAKHEQRL